MIKEINIQDVCHMYYIYQFSNVHENGVYVDGKNSPVIVPLWYTDVFPEAVRFFEAIILTTETHVGH